MSQEAVWRRTVAIAGDWYREEEEAEAESLPQRLE